jgi:hypothetical protein
MRSSIDDIIELYKRDVDVTLITEALKMGPEERILACQDLLETAEELRRAKERARDTLS